MCEERELPTTPEMLLNKLTELGIKYVNTPHPAAYTVEEGEKVWANIKGMHCKNLFCKDAKGVFWLIIAPALKRVNLKTLPNIIGSKRLTFANADLLFEKLGVCGGSVTPFSIINDKENVVHVVLDKEMMEQELVNYHPLKNTATTTITPADLMKFMSACNHRPQIVKVTEDD
ncbi:MAG: prolyl-tRNA synthetase associated domain-containing protein [Alphaproteobacteria bacterium]|nr:prolyl-tRNA synthetase associated domain-containing protein [Alphaproteobacteria bacterium]